MEFTRSGVRKWATRGFLTLAGAILLTVFGQFFVQVATDKGWYAHAGETWDRFVTPLFHFATSAPVLAFALLFGGVVVGLWLDAYLVRRTAKLWWHHVHAFTIRDSACLLANIKRSEFEKSDRAVAIANELRGYVNSGQVPLFLEIEFERPPPDFADPKVRYEPPYERKDIGFDAVISKRTIEGMARGRKWPLPWSLPAVEEGDTFPRPLRRPKPAPTLPPLSDATTGLGRLLGMYATGAKESKNPSPEGETK
jgi:hypothetical protein